MLCLCLCEGRSLYFTVSDRLACRKCQFFIIDGRTDGNVVCFLFQIRRFVRLCILSFLVDPLLSGAEGVAEHGDAPHEEQDEAHAVEDAELQKEKRGVNDTII